MDVLVGHFMNEYELSREEAVKLVNESMTEFEVVKSILQAADRRMMEYEN